jgi:DNA transformation protein
MAPGDPEFARYCCELLASAGPCAARRMFGGWGISVEGLSIAILADLGEGDTLWLKADETTRPRFEAAACKRFTYLVKGEPKSMNYYAAPSEAMESPQFMADWARLALAAAVRARAAKPAKTKTAKRKPAMKRIGKSKAAKAAPIKPARRKN